MIIGTLTNGRSIAKETAAGPDGTTDTVTIEVAGLRVVESVLAVSITGGYKLDEANASISANKVSLVPQYYDYDATADGAAIAVPAATDLSAQTIELIVIGY